MYISCCNITGDIKIKKLKQLYGVHALSMLLVLITYTGVQHDFNITWCLGRLEVARRVPPVEEELEHQIRRWTRMLQTGKQFLLHWWHP
jgi:hypothetical protein